MRKKHICLISTALAALSCMNAYASSISVDYNYNNRTVLISGKANTADTTIAVNLLKPEITADELYQKSNPGDFISYNGEFSSDENSGFSEELKINANITAGEHTLYVGSKGLDRTEIISLYIVEPTEYEGIIGTLNSKTDYTEFETYFKNEKQKIGFVNNDITYNEDNVIRTIYNHIQRKNLDSTKSLENKAIFNSAIVIESIKNNTLPENCIEDIYFEDSNIKNAYIEYVTDDKTKKYFEQKLLSMEITGVDTLESCVRDAVILTVVRYPNGAGNIKDVFEQFNGVLNANISGAELADYEYIAGGEYSNIQTMVSAFNAKVNSITYVGGGASSGGGGGGGSVIASGTVYAPSALNIKFEDLNSVQWAYKAISNLFEKGIVSGKSETLFVPNDNVTREEFVKMLVCAFNLNDGKYDNVFSDVDESAWYADYVAVAYNKGICAGVTADRFGVGTNITRQDMCVMLYNALKKTDVSINGGELTFADSESIGDYAVEAVGALATAKIVNGTGDNMFTPQGLATRAQAAVIIYNAMEFAQK